MSSTMHIPPSLPYLLARIDPWKSVEHQSTNLDYQTVCELIITELELAAEYAKAHA